MTDHTTIVGYFRLALKPALEELQNEQGKGARKALASKVETSVQNLNDILYGRKVGSEDLRHRIAEQLGYDYADIIEIGKKVDQGYSFQAAKESVRNDQQASKILDNSLKEIVAGWDDLTQRQQNTIFTHFKEYLYKNWKRYDHIDNVKGSAAEIFQQIWKLQCEDSGVDLPFGESTVALINSEKMNKIDIFYEARNYVRQARRRSSSSY